MASPRLIAVSLSNCRNVDSGLGVPATRSSISCSVGMKGIFRVIVYFGGSQVKPMYLRNFVYATITFLLRFPLQVCLDITSLTDSGFANIARLFLRENLRLICLVE